MFSIEIIGLSFKSKSMLFVRSHLCDRWIIKNTQNIVEHIIYNQEMAMYQAPAYKM